MPELKVQGFLGSLGEKKGLPILWVITVRTFSAYIKIRCLWLYKYHNG